MSYVIETAYMDLELPIPTMELGPAWALELNAALILVDAHDHSTGKGVLVTPSGLSISADLPFGSNNATLLRSTRFVSQGSALALGTDIGCLYVVGNELYYNDVTGGNTIPITNNGSVTGSAGTITGLPSGTASAAYGSGTGTFTFLQATSTAANMDFGTLVLRYPGSYPTPAGNYIAIQAPSALSGGYAITLPGDHPAASGAFLTSSTSGVIGYTNVDNVTLTITTNVLGIPINVNLPGSGVKENGKLLVVSNTNAAASVALIRVRMDADGNVLAGEGATGVKIGQGQVTVTFTTNFADTPAVVATTENSAVPLVSNVSSPSVSGFLMTTRNATTGVTANNDFSFIAIGQRA